MAAASPSAGEESVSFSRPPHLNSALLILTRLLVSVPLFPLSYYPPPLLLFFPSLCLFLVSGFLSSPLLFLSSIYFILFYLFSPNFTCFSFLSHSLSSPLASFSLVSSNFLSTSFFYYPFLSSLLFSFLSFPFFLSPLISFHLILYLFSYLQLFLPLFLFSHSVSSPLASFALVSSHFLSTSLFS